MLDSDRHSCAAISAARRGSCDFAHSVSASSSEPMSVAHMTRSVHVGGSVGTTDARTSRWCT